MVSSNIETELARAFENLSSRSIDLNDYDGELIELAFDITTSDTFISGIADKILSGDTLQNEDRKILAKPLILDEIFWINSDGQLTNLKDDERLFEHAQQIERLRKICAESNR